MVITLYFYVTISYHIGNNYYIAIIYYILVYFTINKNVGTANRHIRIMKMFRATNSKFVIPIIPTENNLQNVQ